MLRVPSGAIHTCVPLASRSRAHSAGCGSPRCRLLRSIEMNPPASSALPKIGTRKSSCLVIIRMLGPTRGRGPGCRRATGGCSSPGTSRRRSRCSRPTTSSSMPALRDDVARPALEPAVARRLGDPALEGLDHRRDADCQRLVDVLERQPERWRCVGRGLRAEHPGLLSYHEWRRCSCTTGDDRHCRARRPLLSEVASVAWPGPQGAISPRDFACFGPLAVVRVPYVRAAR